MFVLSLTPSTTAGVSETVFVVRDKETDMKKKRDEQTDRTRDDRAKSIHSHVHIQRHRVRMSARARPLPCVSTQPGATAEGDPSQSPWDCVRK